MHKQHIYRVQITIQELDTDGFWDVFTALEIGKNKRQLNESLEKIYVNSKKYIKERLE